MTIPSDKIITEWTMNADQHKSELKDLAKQYRKQASHEKNLEAVRKQLEKQTKQNDSANKGLVSSLKRVAGQMNKIGSAGSMFKNALSVAGGNILSNVLGSINTKMKEMVRLGLDTEDWIGKNASAISGMKTATKGLISDLDLMKAQTRLTTGDFKLNEEQLQAVAKAAVNLTRINKGSFSDSLNKVTNTIKTGSSKSLKELGINMDLVGKSTVKTDTALKLIESRFWSTSIKAENTNEKLDQIKNTLDSSLGKFAAAALNSKEFQSALDQLLMTAQNAPAIIGAFTKTLSALSNVIYLFPVTAIPTLISRVFEAEADKGLQEATVRLNKAKALYAEWKGMREEWANRTKASSKTLGSTMFSFDETGSFKGGGLTGKSKSSKSKSKGKRKSFEDLHPDPAKNKGSNSFKSKINKARENREKKIIARKKKNLSDLAKRQKKLNKVEQENIRIAKENKTVQDELLKSQYEKDAAMANAVAGPMADFATGLWDIAAAAVQGSINTEEAILKMTASVLMSIAQQSTVKAIFEFAQALASYPDVAGMATHAASGVMFLAVAAATGGASLGISSSVPSTSASTGSTGSSSSGSSGSKANAPSYGETVKETKQPVYVNVYLGDHKSPSANLLMAKQIETKIRQYGGAISG